MDEYYPASPYILITTDEIDKEDGPMFILHNEVDDPVLDGYCVYLFKSLEEGGCYINEYNRVTGKEARLINIDPREISDRFNVRYFTSLTDFTLMTLRDYCKNMEMKRSY